MKATECLIWYIASVFLKGDEKAPVPRAVPCKRGDNLDFNP